MQTPQNALCRCGDSNQRIRSLPALFWGREGGEESTAMPENYGCRLAESTQLGADLLYLWSACMIKEMYTYNKLSFLSQIKKLFKHLPSPGAFSSVCPKGFESNSYRFCTTSLVISRHNLCCLILSIEGERRAEQFDSASL